MPFAPPLTGPEVDAAFAGRLQNCAAIHNGGQASVFRAAASVGADVALKIYYPTSPVDDIWARSAREVAAMQAITCPAVVRLHDHGAVEIRGVRSPFICTDFIDGTTLSDAITGNGPMPVAAVARVGCDLLDAIDALWSRKLVHRDMSPRNIMIRPSGAAVLIDLGLARHLGLVSLTMTGLSWGTSGYLSPEQCDGWKNLTCKSDVFTLGIVLEESLLGAHPTGRQQPAIRGGGPDIRPLLPHVDHALTDLLHDMTAREPVRRPMPSIARNALANFI